MVIRPPGPGLMPTQHNTDHDPTLPRPPTPTMPIPMLQQQGPDLPQVSIPQSLSPSGPSAVTHVTHISRDPGTIIRHSDIDSRRTTSLMTQSQSQENLPDGEAGPSKPTFRQLIDISDMSRTNVSLIRTQSSDTVLSRGSSDHLRHESRGSQLPRTHKRGHSKSSRSQIPVASRAVSIPKQALHQALSRSSESVLPLPRSENDSPPTSTEQPRRMTITQSLQAATRLPPPPSAGAEALRPEWAGRIRPGQTIRTVELPDIGPATLWYRYITRPERFYDSDDDDAEV